MILLSKTYTAKLNEIVAKFRNCRMATSVEIAYDAASSTWSMTPVHIATGSCGPTYRTTNFNTVMDIKNSLLSSGISCTNKSAW